MMLNPVDNAVKYSPPGTTVQIMLDYLPETVTLSVQDEGMGIPAEDLAHVFEKFYRGKSALGQQGVGLGLSVVAAIARAHGGKAMVANRPEGGTLFRVVLPGAQA